jgi:signal transduction histidine kinase
VRSDPNRIRQILGNLVSNAVKYTGSGGHVMVKVHERVDDGAPAPGQWIAVDVSDTGPGIPRDKQDQLFREFTRLDPRAAKGAGLGLAISRRIARLLGADITLRSEVGKGSTFTLWLPAEGLERQG